MFTEADIIAQAATADPTTFQGYIDLGTAAIERQAASGAMDPTQAASEEQRFAQDVYSSRATSRNDSDPPP